jgi:hypothetical protein
MPVVRTSSLASIGLLMLVAPGCYRSYVSPYGGYPSAPVQTLTPGGTYTPMPGIPGAAPYGSPMPLDSFGQPMPTVDPTFTPGGAGTNAPFYENHYGSPPPYNGVPSIGVPSGVPTPRDPGEVQFQPSKGSPVADQFGVDSYGSLDKACCTMEKVAKVPVHPVSIAEYLEPVPAEPHDPQPTLAIETEAVSTYVNSRPPYAHDAEHFRWLRGVARRNASNGTWSIVYSVHRTLDDPFGGQLTLAADPLLDQLHPDGVYLISGQLDTARTDAIGRPVYCPHAIEPWQPAPAF